MATGILGRLRPPRASRKAAWGGNQVSPPSYKRGSVVNVAPLRTRIMKFPGKAWPSQTFLKELSGQMVITAAAPCEYVESKHLTVLEEGEYVQQR